MKRLGSLYAVHYRERVGTPVVMHKCLLAPPGVKFWFENGGHHQPAWHSWIGNHPPQIETECPFCDTVFPPVRDLMDLLMNEVVALR